MENVLGSFERRIFKSIEQFLQTHFPVNSIIRLKDIEKYSIHVSFACFNIFQIKIYMILHGVMYEVINAKYRITVNSYDDEIVYIFSDIFRELPNTYVDAIGGDHIDPDGNVIVLV
jgi:hypothetical protein